ncbi:hypothetical protein AAHE18_14G155100 [Arachis hypogaea]
MLQLYALLEKQKNTIPWKKEESIFLAYPQEEKLLLTKMIIQQERFLVLFNIIVVWKPGPTWSTTDPCVMAEPPSSSLSSSSVITIEDYNKNNSSYSSWWMGFLDDLDGKNMNIIDNNEETSLDCYPFVDNNSKDGICYESQSLVDAIDLSCCYADDWLMVPTMEKDWGEIV